MKKLFTLIVLTLVLNCGLFAQQALHSQDTSAETWYFGAVSVTWSFVNVIANPNGDGGEMGYNAILTINNNTSNDIQDWNFIMDEMDQITSLCGARLLTMPANPNALGSRPVYYIQDNRLGGNVIPARGSLSIRYSAVTKDDIHKPASLTFFPPSVDFDSDPYND